MRQGNNDDSADYILGNGQTSNSYAIKGVGFGIVNVAMPMRFSENENVTMLYAFRKAETADLLATIGLPDGTGRYEKADAMTGWDARAPQVLTQNIEISPEAVKWLADHGSKIHGVEGPSTDIMDTKLFPSHRACRDLGLTHYEWLVNLTALIGKGEFQFYGVPLLLDKGTGSPVRAFAVVET